MSELVATPIIVARDQDRRTGLCKTLTTRYNTPSQPGDIPVDLFWMFGENVAMGDLKTPSDLIASSLDGRLDKQVDAMKKAKAYGFILIEGDWSPDGFTVGTGKHTWEFAAFNNLIASLQEEGVRVLCTPSQRTTARELAAFYKRLKSGSRGSWHRPEVIMPPYEDKDGDVRVDDDYRRRLGMVMHLPGCGVEKGERLLKAFGLKGTLGITDEALLEAQSRWQTLPGIGKGLALNWSRFINEIYRGK